MSRRGVDWVVVGGVLGLALLILAPTFYLVAAYQNEKSIVCTVEDKDRASNGDGGSDMRVYTSECGNLVVKDALFRGNFHASDTYADIEVGQTYRFVTIGFRIPFLSEFPNIVEVAGVSR